MHTSSHVEWPVNLDQEIKLGVAAMQPTAGGTSATHASTATLSRQEAGLLPTSTYPRSPSCWHVCLHDGPSWPSSGSWQLGPFDSMNMCEGCTQRSLGCTMMRSAREAHGGCWTCYDVMKQHGEPWAKLRGGRGVVGSKSGKQTLAPRTNTYASNVSHDTLQGCQETSQGTCYTAHNVLGPR